MASVRDDDVVGQGYVHGLGGFPHEFRQPLVVVAGVRVAGGMVVDKGITLCDLQGMLDRFVQALFGPEVKTRLRPSYFPFTEPSVEVDVSCFECHGKGCPRSPP